MKTTITILNGYWTINGKRLSKCTDARKTILARVIKDQLITSSLPNSGPTLKSRAKEIKKHNYVFTFPNRKISA